jgi:hypothetical protein
MDQPSTQERSNANGAAEQVKAKMRRINHAELLITLVAAVGACIAAGAALWQARVARDTEYRQLRAYLSVSHTPMALDGSDARVSISVRHSGATPAYNVRIDTAALVGKYSLNDDYLGDPVTMGGADNRQIAILNSNDKFDFTISQSNTEALKLLTSRDKLVGEHALYVHGIVRYQDIFGIEGNQPERRYEFCFVFRPSIDPAGSERGCEKYNKPG